MDEAPRRPASRNGDGEFSLRAQELGERTKASSHGLEERAAESSPRLLRGRAARHLVRSIELDPRLMRQSELDLKAGTGLAEPPK